MRAYGEPPVEERFRGLVLKAIRQRIERHRHPEAVADALRVVPRSTAFDGVEALEHVAVPDPVVASRDDLDPEHPMSRRGVCASGSRAPSWSARSPGVARSRGAERSCRGRSDFLERNGDRPRCLISAI